MRLFLRFGGLMYGAGGGFRDTVKICDTLADALNTTRDAYEWQQVCLIDNGQPYIIAELETPYYNSEAEGDWQINPEGMLKLTTQENVYLLSHRRLGENP